MLIHAYRCSIYTQHTHTQSRRVRSVIINFVFKILTLNEVFIHAFFYFCNMERFFNLLKTSNLRWTKSHWMWQYLLCWCFLRLKLNLLNHFGVFTIKWKFNSSHSFISSISSSGYSMYFENVALTFVNLSDFSTFLSSSNEFVETSNSLELFKQLGIS